MTNWKRTISVVLGACLWMTFDAITGKPINQALCLMAGFIGAWCMEGRE